LNSTVGRTATAGQANSTAVAEATGNQKSIAVTGSEKYSKDASQATGAGSAQSGKHDSSNALTYGGNASVGGGTPVVGKGGADGAGGAGMGNGKGKSPVSADLNATAGLKHSETYGNSSSISADSKGTLKEDIGANAGITDTSNHLLGGKVTTNTATGSTGTGVAANQGVAKSNTDTTNTGYAESSQRTANQQTGSEIGGEQLLNLGMSNSAVGNSLMAQATSSQNFGAYQANLAEARQAGFHGKSAEMAAAAKTMLNSNPEALRSSLESQGVLQHSAPATE
jgi:hypothetical protein